MPRRAAGRSIFSSLPLDIRQAIRSQILQPAPVPETQDVSRDLLPTQPPSPDSENEPLDSLATPKATSPSVVQSNKQRVLSLDKPRKKRKTAVIDNKYVDHPWDCSGLVARYTKPAQVPAEIVKYWYQRHFLLPQYDRLPLLLDDIGWFSITPQPIAKHIAERCQCDLIIDAFCGVGGNAVEFAKTCERVIAIDNDPTRLRIARHNALHLGVADRIDFILADYVQYAQSITAGEEMKQDKVDVVFLSPPWGGPDYLSFGSPIKSGAAAYPLSAILPIHGAELFALSSKLSPNIAYYLPRNADINELSKLALPFDDTSAEGGLAGQAREWMEVEEAWVGDKLKAITAYYGGLISD